MDAMPDPTTHDDAAVARPTVDVSGLNLADATFVQLFTGIWPADLYGFYAEMRAERPVHRCEFGPMWVVTRYDDVQGVVRDRRFGKGEITAAELDLAFFDDRPSPNPHDGTSMVFLNPPEYTLQRALISRAFTPKRVDQLRGFVEHHVDALLDGVAEQGEVDVLESFAFDLPVHVIGELVGVPDEMRDRFKVLVPENGMFMEPGASAAQIERAAASRIEMFTAFGQLVYDRKREPRDDLITALIEAREGDERLRRRDLIGILLLLFGAGFETTMNMIGNGLYTLLRHPEQLARLQADPSLVPSAVEEMLRFESITQMIGRMALEDAEIGGVTIPKGEHVFPMLGSANRDPARFPDADRFDVGRTPNEHLAFSGGIRYCLGASLARMELNVLFERLIARFPTMELLEDAPPWQPRVIVRGLERLPVRFGST